MAIKKIEKDTERFEWYKTRLTQIGDIEVSGWDYKTKMIVNGLFRRLVTCSEFGKVLGVKRGKPYPANSIYVMANRGKLNKFLIGGITFILMTDEQYREYKVMESETSRKEDDAKRRKVLMQQPANRDQSFRFMADRLAAEIEWREGKLTGEEWDKFFTEVFPTFEDKFTADSIGEWLAGSEYHADPSTENGIVNRVRIRSSELWKEYREWCKEKGYVSKYIKEFSMRLADEGFVRRYSGGRSFDVFMAGKDEVDGMAVMAILMKNEEAVKKREDEKERMEEMMAARREKMAEKLLWEDETVWLNGVTGRHEGSELLREYEAWCRQRKMQPKGKRRFYAWLEQEGCKRETQGGKLWFEKK